jgi:hypothetical protein
MAKGSDDPFLNDPLSALLQETRGKVMRAEEVADLRQISSVGKKCDGLTPSLSERGAEGANLLTWRAHGRGLLPGRKT